MESSVMLGSIPFFIQPHFGGFWVSRFLVGINFRHPNVIPNFAGWKTITYRLWHRWCCQPRF